MSDADLLNQQLKANFEIALVEIHEKNVLIHYPERDDCFEIISLNEWMGDLLFRVISVSHHPDGAKYKVQANQRTDERVATFAYLIPLGPTVKTIKEESPLGFYF